MNSTKENNRIKLYLAPLQGYIDYVFRNALFSLSDKPDLAFSPFIETHKPDKKMYRDVLKERNQNIPLIPQILGNNASEMLSVIRELNQMGYSEVNWNLGCPYPMVTKKLMGAGLLPFPEKIYQILDSIYSGNDMKLSIKMRLGLNNPSEWEQLTEVLNKFPLTEIIIHGRTASQMYKGEIDTEAFKRFSLQLLAPVCYNGDIVQLDDFVQLKENLPHISRWMIGRGIIANPLLIRDIRTGEKSKESEITDTLALLHRHLLYLNTERLNGNSHVLNKMKPYWEYFAWSLRGKEKILKKIKKSVSLEIYQSVCSEIFK